MRQAERPYILEKVLLNLQTPLRERECRAVLVWRTEASVPDTRTAFVFGSLGLVYVVLFTQLGDRPLFLFLFSSLSRLSQVFEIGI